MSLTLGRNLLVKTHDYVTPLGQKLQYFADRLYDICPFIAYKYEITPKYHSMECFPVSILESAYKNLNELVVIHTECWGNENALNCIELLSSWHMFRNGIENKYFHKHSILAIVYQDLPNNSSMYSWTLIEGNIDLSNDKFIYISIDKNDHIQKDLDKINKYPYGLAKFPEYAYIDFMKYPILLNKETNDILQIRNSEEYRIIGLHDKDISAFQMFSTVWEK